MKTSVLNKLLPLLLIAFLNVFNSTATSYSSTVLDLNSRNYDYLQQDQNTQAAFFGELISQNLTPHKSKEYSSGFSLNNILVQHVEFTNLEFSNIEFWNYILDSKTLITQQLFPFQFFW